MAFPQRPPSAPQPAAVAQTPVPLPPERPAGTPDATAAPKQATDAAPQPALPPERRLNMVRTAPEQLGQVPDHFFWIRDGLMAVRDPVDGRLVFLSDDGRVAGRATLPKAFEIADIIGDKEAIRLLDAGGRGQVTIARTIDPAATTELQEQTIASNGGARAMRLRRRGAQELILQDERRAGTKALEIRSAAGGDLAQAYEIGVGGADNRYVVSEEIAAAKPRLKVRVFVQRFDRAGKLTGVAHVPLDGMDSVPRDFITVTGDGVVRVLLPMADGVKIREVAFTTPSRAQRLNDEDIKSLGRTSREIPVETNVIGDPSLHFRREGPRLELRVPTPPITRAKAIENARGYLTVNWVMQPENYEKPRIENACVPERYKFWLRPRHFSKEQIGTTIGPMPYRWGGEDTPETFRVRTEWGALAGDVCTCRIIELNYCVFPESAGVDCSGFVSRAWGIDKRGTSGLLDVADDVDSIAALKPGDAFNWPQRHVRLFTGMTPGAAIAFTVLESTTRLECEGVCERSYRPSEVDGYRLIRYRAITENGVAVNGTNPAGTAPAAPQVDATSNGTTTPPGATQTAAPQTGAKPNGTTSNGTAPNGSKPNGATNGASANGAGQNRAAKNGAAARSAARNGTVKNGTTKRTTEARPR